MEDKIKTVPRSYRISDDTAEKIKEISEQLGGNQQQAFAKLVEAYEFQKGKANLLDKKEDIEKYEHYASLLIRMYMNSLEDNQNITESVRSEYESQLYSKDLTIKKLQDENAGLEEDNSSYKEAKDKLYEENEILRGQIAKSQLEAEERKASYETMIRDKDGLNQALASTVNDLKSQIKNMESKVTEAEEITGSYQALKKDADNLKNEVGSLNQEIKSLNKQYNTQLEAAVQKASFEAEKSMLKMEREHQGTLQTLKAEHQAEINDYQQKYLKLLESMQNRETKPVTQK